MTIFPQNSKTLSFLRNGAFTLIELLVTMTLASMLIAASAPVVAGLFNGNQMNGTLSELTGMLEQARQYAISNNTYVWVAFEPATASNGVANLNAVVFASKSGSDPTDWSTSSSLPSYYGSIPTSEIGIVGKPQSFSNVLLANAGSITATQIPNLPATTYGAPDSPASSTAGFFNAAVHGVSTKFTLAFQFTPSGSARKSSSLSNWIELDLTPAMGAKHDVAVLRVSGLTGLVNLYRP